MISDQSCSRAALLLHGQLHRTSATAAQVYGLTIIQRTWPRHRHTLFQKLLAAPHIPPSCTCSSRQEPVTPLLSTPCTMLQLHVAPRSC